VTHFKFREVYFHCCWRYPATLYSTRVRCRMDY